jgi:CHAT domain-containing protein/tetratricopeptide (TPR) repeat protein
MSLLAGLLVAALAGQRTLDDCDALARDHPKEISSYLCYWLTARSLNALDDGARRLDARLAIEPDNHLAELYLGLIEADLHHDRALALFERAAAGLAAERNATGEVYARISIAYIRQGRGDRSAAAEALAQARKTAEASGDPLLVARMDWEESRQAFLTAEYGTAWALASKADAALTPGAPLDLRSGVLASLGATCWALGRHRDAFEYFERQAEILHAAGNLWPESQARSNMAILGGALLAEGDMDVDEVRRLTRAAFDTALAAKNPWVEGDVRLLLAQDPALPYPERVAHLEAVLAKQDKPERVGEALRLLAGLRLQADPADPDAALALIERAESVARGSGSPLEIALSAVARMNYDWTVGPRERAIASTRAALDAVERIRDLQRDELVRARWFSEQAIHYYRAAGRVLESEPGAPSPESLDLAFSIVERMRARTLLDSLDAQRASAMSARSPEPLEVRRQGVLGRIADAQRTLVRGTAQPGEKDALLLEINRLESEEQVLRDTIARGNPQFATLRSPRIPRIPELQALLAPDEAMLAFQLSTRRIDDSHRASGGGSWVFVVTSSDAGVFPLPDADVLRRSIDVYLGTFARRDGLDRVASGRLYDELLAEPLRVIPSSVRRLVVVPDRDLHRLPFHALTAASGGAPLAERFDISIVPSATIWARSRREPPSGAPAHALALADPDLPERAAASTHRQATRWEDALQLGPLPNARKEARGLARLLGGRCDFRGGTDASEHELKRTELADYGLLVLATHAVVDEERPDRSAVLLSPGAPDEDGLLQPREIAELALDGKLVVLSSCGSATGTLLRGEGTVGLARAFFRGGARAVVASLWPMRDDEAAAVAGSFYRHLCRGDSAGQALAAARRDRIAEGAPAAEWAGLVLLGDAELVPFPGGAGTPWLRWIAPIAILLATVAGGLLLMRRIFSHRGDLSARIRPSP